jgi:16S rRNA G966 N2-methylase RsmD
MNALICGNCDKVYKMKYAYDKHVLICTGSTAKKPAASKIAAPGESAAGTVVALEPTRAAKPLNANFVNREALRDKVHEIHNFIRNNGGGYGFSAMRLFNFFYGLRCIEKYNLYELVGWTDEPKYKFSHALDILSTQGDTAADEHVHQFKGIIRPNSQLSRILHPVISNSVSSVAIGGLMRRVDELAKLEDRYNLHLSGKIYEYFIGRESSYISELGAYFTDRHIVDYLMDKVLPGPGVDSRPFTMIDPFGGSGGFTLAYIQQLISAGVTDWSSTVNNIYHYDINEDVIRSVNFEILCLTKQMTQSENVACANSFTSSFGEKTFDYVFTNPPYGGDKIAKSDNSVKRTKLKKYIQELLAAEEDKEKSAGYSRQLAQIRAEETEEARGRDMQTVSVHTSSVDRVRKYAAKHLLSGNDKESVSLILIMELLSERGTACAVLKEGMFFDAKYADLRKHLVEKFNVRMVISIDSKQFENTSTKTSAVIFGRGATTRIEFYELVVDRFPADVFAEFAGEVYLAESAGDIQRVGDRLVTTADSSQLLANSYILDAKTYNRKNVVAGPGYKLVKFGELCKPEKKSKRPASFGSDRGPYEFYVSSARVKRCESADYPGEHLIVGGGGVANIHLGKNFSCSNHCYVFGGDQYKYVYYLLCSRIELVENGFRGSTLENLSKKYLEALMLPVPDAARADQWIVRLDSARERLREGPAAEKEYAGILAELRKEAFVE